MSLLETAAEVLQLVSSFTTSVISNAIDDGLNKIQGKITKILLSVLIFSIGILLFGFGLSQLIDSILHTIGIGAIITGLLLLTTSAFLMK